MNFKKVNNITGWIVCFIACTVYIMTMEATGSFWDCGEFISSAYKVQIPHPPGAPLFVILGRIFIVLFGWMFGNGPESAARAANLMSALSSGFTILFLFWSITHFARKIIAKNTETISGQQLFAIMSAGVVGALAYTFSDSFWFSAVEGEVYAMSSLFTALVFWAMLKWEHAADKPNADRWIIFIFFMMGLSIGVHLLNLLTIPAIVMIYYFKRYKATRWGTFWAFLMGCLITGFVQVIVIQDTIKWAGKFDIWFVNGLNMPFFSGFTFFFILLVVLLLLIGRYAKKKSLSFLSLGIWCFAFMLIGYSTYLTTMIRSNADPAIDMYNVDNPNSLVGYLGRDQYGDFPLLYGQVFTAQPVDYKETSMKYTKSKDKYEEAGMEKKPEYAPEDMMLFPRVWDASNDQGHAEFYKTWLNLADGEKPDMADNISFFFGYQLNWMYFRYFMWNFAGKQNDIQGFAPSNVRDGNWITGISLFDNMRLGNQSEIPDSIKNNKAHNTLFMLPFILGLIGVVYHYKKNRKDFLVTLLLFFFTGIAIVLYLNQAGNQPRERDYAYVGSFYAFAIWIGLGVLQVAEWLRKKMSESASNYTAAALCFFAVPMLMASQEWDDHDRSNKTLARDLAKDYLESCAPNAILFTYGDNDTYPLWYAQEVEGIRRDIRVINNSLLGIDWYINELRYKVNESDPIDVIWNADKIREGIRDYIPYYENPEVSKNEYMDVYHLMHDFIGSDEQNAKVSTQGGESVNYFPTKKLSVPVDEAFVRANKTVNADDSVVAAMQFDIPNDKNYLMKNDMAVLNIIAANKWKRPIYFTAPSNELGFGKYLRRDGLAYHLVPVKNNNDLNVNWMMDKLMNKFAFGNAEKKGVYFDEENRRHLMDIRMGYAELANKLADVNRKEDAKAILNKADKNILPSNYPYALVSRYNQHNSSMIPFLEAAYKSGDSALADKVLRALKKDLDQQMRYYSSLGENMSNEQLTMETYTYLRQGFSNLSHRQEALARDIYFASQMIMQLSDIEKRYKEGNKKPNAADSTGAPVSVDSGATSVDTTRH